MTIVPNQPFGLGDIIFCQTLVRRIANGNPIVWPVFPQFVDQLNRAYPDIKFVDYNRCWIDYERKEQHEADYKGERITVLPLRHAAEIMGVGYEGWMSSKYELYGMDCQDWRENAMWERALGQEFDLGIKEFARQGIHINFTGNEQDASDEYTLTNGIFGSDCKLKVNIPSFKKELKMSVIDGYSLFDWVGVMKNASAIHVVNSSIIYLLEMLDLKAKEVHLYQRSIPGQTFAGIDYLLKRHKYVFHG